jgi:transketolase
MNDTEKLKELRRRILEAAHYTHEGHIASAFSVLEIIYSLYRYWLWYTPLDPKIDTRDYFILSKGHGAMALYAVLSEMKFFPQHMLNNYCQAQSILGGHPDRLKVPGVEVSTGSLGHGLPMAVGLARALKAERKTNKVVCLIGDGEMNEGSVWESLLLAGRYGLEGNGLGNLTVVLDYNHSTDAALDLAPVVGKVFGFHWDTRQCDGHDLNEFGRAFVPGPAALPNCPPTNRLPRLIIASTIKGKGVKAIEENPQAWHHRSPSAFELNEFLHELAPAPITYP